MSSLSSSDLQELLTRYARRGAKLIVTFRLHKETIDLGLVDSFFVGPSSKNHVSVTWHLAGYLDGPQHTHTRAIKRSSLDLSDNAIGLGFQDSRGDKYRVELLVSGTEPDVWADRAAWLDFKRDNQSLVSSARRRLRDEHAEIARDLLARLP